MPDKKDSAASGKSYQDVSVDDLFNDAPADKKTSGKSTYQDVSIDDIFDDKSNKPPSPTPAVSRRPTPLTAVVNGTDPDESRLNLDFIGSVVNKYADMSPASAKPVIIPTKNGSNFYHSDDTGFTEGAVDNSGGKVKVKATKTNAQGQKSTVNIQGDNAQQVIGAIPAATKTLNEQVTADNVPDVVRPLSAEDLQRAQETARTELQSSRAFISNIADQYKEQIGNTLLLDNGKGEVQGGMQTVKQNQSQQGILSGDNFMNRVFNTNGDMSAMNTFVVGAKGAIQSAKQKELNALGSVVDPLLDENYGDAGVQDASKAQSSADFAKYNEQKAAIIKKYDDQQTHLMQAAHILASQKAVNEKIQQVGVNGISKIDPVQIGMEVQRQLGNHDQVDKDRATIDRGRPLDPESKVQYELQGYKSFNVATMDQFSQDRQPIVQQLAEKTKNFQQKVLDNNPEFVKQQKIKALSSQIYKDENAFLSSVADNDPNQEDIDKAAEKLGLSKADIAGITPNDIQNPKVWYKQAVGSFISNAAGGIYKLGMRGVANAYEATGGDVDWEGFNNKYDQNWYANNDTPLIGGKSLMGGTPQGSSLFQDGTQVNMDKSDPNYLMTEKNPNAGKFNFDVRAILGQVGNGAGQIAAFGYAGNAFNNLYKAGRLAAGASTLARNEMMLAEGTNAFGKALSADEKLAIAFSPDKAAAIADQGMAFGTTVSTFATQYADNYADAIQTIGDADKDEGKRMLYAGLKTTSSALTEQILPDAKIMNNILGPETGAGRELIDLIMKEGVDGIKKSGKQIVIKGLKEGIIDWQKEISEDILDNIGGAITDAMLAPKQYDATDYMEQQRQTYITSAISSALPTISGGFKHATHASKMQRAMMFEVGSNPSTYIDDINQQIQDGKFSQADGNARIQIVNTMSDIVDKHIPAESPVNGKQLTPAQKLDYGHNLLVESMLKAKAAGIEDEVQKKAIEKNITTLQAQREDILNNAGEKVKKSKKAVSPESTTVSSSPSNTSSDESTNEASGEVQGENSNQNGKASESEQEAADGLRENVNSKDGSGEAKAPATKLGLQMEEEAHPEAKDDLNLQEEKNTQVVIPKDENPVEIKNTKSIQQQQIDDIEDRRRQALEANARNSDEYKGLEQSLKEMEADPKFYSKEDIERRKAKNATQLEGIIKDHFYSKIINQKYDKELSDLRNTPLTPKESDKNVTDEAIIDTAIDQGIEAKEVTGDAGQDADQETPRETVTPEAKAPPIVAESKAEPVVKEPAKPKAKSGKVISTNPATKLALQFEEEPDESPAATAQVTPVENNISPQNTVSNATTGSQEQAQQEASGVGSVGEHSAIDSGQQEQRQASSTTADNSNSNDQSQGRTKGTQQAVEKKVAAPVDHITTTGLRVAQKVNGDLSVTNKRGFEVTPATRAKAILEAAHAYNFTAGETARDEHYTDIKDVVAHTTSPTELAAVFVGEPRLPLPLTSTEKVIAENGVGVISRSSWKDFTGISASEDNAHKFVREDGSDLTQIADDITREQQSIHRQDAISVSAQDIVDFVRKFPRGINADATTLSPTAKEAAKKFKALTGFDLEEKNLGSKVAGIALEQYESGGKLSEAEKSLLNDEYESTDQFRQAYERAIAEGRIAPPAEISNSNFVAQPVREQEQGQSGATTADAGSNSIGSDFQAKLDEAQKAVTDSNRKLQQSRATLSRLQTQAQKNASELQGSMFEAKQQNLLGEAGIADQSVLTNAQTAVNNGRQELFTAEEALQALKDANPGQADLFDAKLPQAVNEALEGIEKQIDNTELAPDEVNAIVAYADSHVDDQGQMIWPGLAPIIRAGVENIEKLGESPKDFTANLAAEVTQLQNNTDANQQDTQAQPGTADEGRSGESISENADTTNSAVGVQTEGGGSDNSSTDQTGDQQSAGTVTESAPRPVTLPRPESTGNKLQDEVNLANWERHVIDVKETRMERQADRGEQVSENDRKSLAVYKKRYGDRIRALKISNPGLALTTPLAPVRALWNTAVEIVARAVDSGVALHDAIIRGIEHIDSYSKVPWDVQSFKDSLGWNAGNVQVGDDVRKALLPNVQLSAGNKTEMDRAIRAIQNGEEKVSDVLRDIDSSPLSDKTKGNLKAYIQNALEEDTYKQQETSAKSAPKDPIGEQQQGKDFLSSFTPIASDENSKFVSGKTLTDIFGEEPAGSQTYMVSKLNNMLADGDNMIALAQRAFGDGILEYGPQLLEHAKAMGDSPNKAVLMATFLGRLQEARLTDTANRPAIQSLLSQATSEWQKYIRQTSLNLNAARLLRLYRDKYLSDFFTDKILEEAERRDKSKIQDAEINAQVSDEVAATGISREKNAVVAEEKSKARDAEKKAATSDKKDTRKSGPANEYKEKAEQKIAEVSGKNSLLDKIKEAIKKINCP